MAPPTKDLCLWRARYAEAAFRFFKRAVAGWVSSELYFSRASLLAASLGVVAIEVPIWCRVELRTAQSFGGDEDQLSSRHLVGFPRM